MGRYPTISLAFDMVTQYGHAFGSTLLQGLAMTVNAPATLLHIPLKVPEPEAMTALVGQYIYQDPSINGVVPGTLAELYFNFGTLGVFGGFFLIGRIAKVCISMTHSAVDMGTLLLMLLHHHPVVPLGDTHDRNARCVPLGDERPSDSCLRRH